MDHGLRTTAVVFPFDLFGSGGAGAGAALVGDELREVVGDFHRETVPTRAAAYADRLRLREFTFETLADYDGWRSRGRQVIRQLLKRGDFLLWLAGNHLGVLPLYDELSGQDCLVVQLDAHLDIHQFAACTTEMSHGNFLLHCDGPLPPIVNVGHRDLLLPPGYVAQHYRLALPAEALAVEPEKTLAALREASRGAARVFLDIDCDVLDAAFFPAVAEPVPFGLTPQQLLRAWTPPGRSGWRGSPFPSSTRPATRPTAAWPPWCGCWNGSCFGVTSRRDLKL